MWFFFFFAIDQLESATGIHTFPPSWIPQPAPSLAYPSGLSQSTGFRCPASHIELALVIYFTYGNGHVSIIFSQIIPPSPFPTESKSPFFTSVSPLLPWMYDHWYHLSKFHIYVLICSICLSLSDLLHYSNHWCIYAYVCHFILCFLFVPSILFFLWVGWWFFKIPFRFFV